MSLVNSECPEVKLTSNALMLFMNSINEVLHGLPKQNVEWLGQGEIATLTGLHKRLVRTEPAPGIIPVSLELNKAEYDLLRRALRAVLENMDSDEFHARLGVFKNYAEYTLRTLGTGQVVSAPTFSVGLTVDELTITSNAIVELCQGDGQDYLRQTGASQEELLGLAHKIVPSDNNANSRDQSNAMSINYDELMAIVHAMRLYGDVRQNDTPGRNETEQILRKLVGRAGDPGLLIAV